MRRTLILKQIIRLQKIYGNIKKVDELWPIRHRVLLLEEKCWILIKNLP